MVIGGGEKGKKVGQGSKEKKKKENGRGSPSMDDFQRVGGGTRVQGRVGRRRAGRSLVLMNL